MTNTFPADIVYIALLDRVTEMIEFPFYDGGRQARATVPIAARRRPDLARSWRGATHC